MTPELDESIAWVDMLRQELAQLGPTDQFLATGEWISFITFRLLPELAQRRREVVLELLDASDGATNSSVAALLGIRKPTIDRLVEEGRSAKKREQAAGVPKDWDESLADSPPLPVG